MAEQQQQQESLFANTPTPSKLHTLGVGLSNLAPGLVSNILPDPNAHGVQAFIPGIASGTYAGADFIGTLAQKALGATDESVMHLPGAERAGELADNSQKFADRWVPHMDAKSELEGSVKEYSNLIGSMINPAGEVGLARLPATAAKVARVAMPGKVAATVGVGAKGLIDNVVAPALEGDGKKPVDISLSSPAQAATPTPPTGPVTESLFDSTPVQPVAAGMTKPPPAGSMSLFDPVDPRDSLFHTDTQAEQESSGHSWQEYAMYGGGAALVALGGRRALKFSRDYAKTKFVDASAQWHADVAANGGVAQSEALLPGTTGTPTTNFRQNVMDRNATMTEYARSIADSPVIADQIRAYIGDINGAQPILQRFQAGAEKGELLGQKMPSLTRTYQQIAKLTDAQQELLNKGMHYGNELDNRFNNTKTMLGKPPGTLPDEAVRVRFPELDSTQLRAGRDAAYADPQVRAIMDTLKIQSDAKIDMLVKNNMLTQGEGQRIKDAHKHYVPDANMDNIVLDPLLERNITPYSGSSTLPLVWKLMDQHDFKLFQATEENRVRSELINRGRAYQAKDLDPSRPGIKPTTLFEDSKDKFTGEWVAKNDGRTLAFRNNGMLEHVQVNNRRMFDALQGPPVQTNTVLNGMNKARQFQQSFITGPGAIATGHIFPFINAARSVGEIAALRPAGMYGTHLDKLAQKATGGRLSLRGDPVSGYPGMLYQILAGTGAESMRAVSHILDGNGSTAIGSQLRTVFGNNVIDAVHERAKLVYENSTRGTMRDRGLLNSAGFSSSDAASNQHFMSKGGDANMPSRDMVPELFQVDGMLGNAKPTYVHLRNLFDEMRSIVGEAAHANFFALNKDNAHITPHQLNYELRHITGDPGTRGAGAAIRTYGATVPFGNVSMQEVGRVMRAFNEEPVGTTLGYLFHYGTLAMASVFTAMLAGPDAIKHLFDSTTDQQRSNNAQFYLQTHPDNPIKLPVQIMMRPAFNLMLQMFHDLFSLNTHKDDPELANQIMHMMMDFFSKHVWSSTIDGTVAGISSGLPPTMPTGLGPAYTMLSGQSADVNLYDAWKNRDKPINKMFSHDVTGENTRLPGQIGKVDPVTGTSSGMVWQNIIANVMGIGGVAIWNALKQFENARTHGEPISHALDNIMQDYRMRFMDDIPGANTLWGESKLSRSTPLQQTVEQRLDKMRPLTSWKGDMVNQGLTRKGGQQLIEPVDPNTPTDPVMRQMYATAGKYMSFLDTKPNSPLKLLSDLRKQVGALERSTLSPQTVRSLKNEYERQIQNEYANTLAFIHQMDAQLSKIAGVPVDIRDIDFKKGPEQFAPAP